MVISHMCQGLNSLYMVIPPSIRNPYNGYINHYYWVDEFIPYCMEIMGVLSLDPGTYEKPTDSPRYWDI